MQKGVCVAQHTPVQCASVWEESMNKKKALSLVLVTALAGSALITGCGSQSTASTDTAATTAATQESAAAESTAAAETETANGELPTIKFVHGYYQTAEEWPAAEVMRQIYADFAELHKDEYTFEAVADETGGEGIYNTALNDLSSGEFYDIADFGGWDITPVASEAGAILDLKPYLDEDQAFKDGVGVCYDQNLTDDGKIYTVREQVEAIGFWYNENLFNEAGADTPDKWQTWDDFNTAVDKLVAAGINPFGLNGGWPSNILTGASLQRNEASREFYQNGLNVTDFNTDAFKETVAFMQDDALGKIDTAYFGPGGDDDNAYTDTFKEGKSAMLFNGVWAAGDAAEVDGAKPAVFPTDEPGKKAALMTGGCGLVVSSKLDEAQTAAAIDFLKYMTSPEIAAKIVEAGVGMAPSTTVDYKAIEGNVTDAAGKLLVEACNLCQSADYQSVGFGTAFGGGIEGEMSAKYAGLKDGSKTPDDVAQELNDFVAAE